MVLDIKNVTIKIIIIVRVKAVIKDANIVIKKDLKIVEDIIIIVPKNIKIINVNIC